MKQKKQEHTEHKVEIGSRTRDLREKMHLTLHDLAAKTGLNKEVLNEIEVNEVVPPVAALLKISQALGVRMAHFFEKDVSKIKVSLTRKKERVRIKGRPHHHIGEVNYTYESLESKKADKHMDPFFVEFKYVDTSDLVFTSHDGEEFVYLLEGRLEFRTNDMVAVLDSGDSIYFQSDLNHSLRSLNKKSAKAVVIVWSKP